MFAQYLIGRGIRFVIFLKFRSYVLLPGLNAAIRAIVLSAINRGWEVYGSIFCYRGVLENDYLIHLDRDAVRGITHIGGTILGTTNKGDPFNYPVKTQNGVTLEDLSGQVVEKFHRFGFDALIIIGDDGSLRIAQRFVDLGLPIIAVLKTIDNDLSNTDITFGFDTAVTTATEALDKFHSTAKAYERVMVVGVMGRYAGWIPLTAIPSPRPAIWVFLSAIEKDIS